MRALLYRHPIGVSLSIALVVFTVGYVAHLVIPVAAALLTPVALTTAFLFLLGKMPKSLLDWVFVILFVVPFAGVVWELLQEVQPIVPLVLAVGTTFFVRNKLAIRSKSSHGVHDSSHPNRGV